MAFQFLLSLIFLWHMLPLVVSVCEDVSPGAWWDAWQGEHTHTHFGSGIGICHVALLPRERCTFVSLIRRIRLETPDFRVLDIGATFYPWSIQSGIVDVIFDFQATNHVNCFSTAEMAAAEKCCSARNDECFDDLFTRERCCRGNQPLVLGIIEGDVTDAEGEGWAKVFRLVQLTGKFDLVITSHLLEDLTDPQVVVRQLPKGAHAGLVRVPSKYSEFSRHDAPQIVGCSRKHRGAMHHRWVFTVQEEDLLAIPKFPYLEHDESFKEVEKVVLNASMADMALLWRGTLPLRLLNNGWMGPSEDAIVSMIRAAVLGPDAVDALALKRATDGLAGEGTVRRCHRRLLVS